MGLRRAADAVLPVRILSTFSRAAGSIRPQRSSAPYQRQRRIEFLGEISDAEKGKFLGEAAALLFPIDWPEPFGLVMIEAMANGTPVVAFRCGAVPEIIDDGVTGLVVDSIEEAVVAVPRALKLSRVRVRREFERRFCADRMARDYLAVYEGQCHGRAVRRPRLQIA